MMMMITTVTAGWLVWSCCCCSALPQTIAFCSTSSWSSSTRANFRWLSAPRGLSLQSFTALEGHGDTHSSFDSSRARTRAVFRNSQPITCQEISIDPTAATATSLPSSSVESALTTTAATNNKNAGVTQGERIAQGKSVILVRDLLTLEECRALVDDCIQVAQSTHRTELETQNYYGSSSSSSGTTSPVRDKSSSQYDDSMDKGATQPTDTDIKNVTPRPPLARLPTKAAVRRAMRDKITCANPLPDHIDLRLQQILQRICHIIDQQLPSLSLELFQTDSLSDLIGKSLDLYESNHDDTASYTDPLIFSAREPAINVYTAGGEFLPHKDDEALTILLPLSVPEIDFLGGGTAFWAQHTKQHDSAHSLLLKPPAGTAMLFGGCVTHAGKAVVQGTRVVFVCSFSRRGTGESTTTGLMNLASNNKDDDDDDDLSRLLLSAADDWHDKWMASELRDSCPDA